MATTHLHKFSDASSSKDANQEQAEIGRLRNEMEQFRTAEAATNTTAAKEVSCGGNSRKASCDECCGGDCNGPSDSRCGGECMVNDYFSCREKQEAAFAFILTNNVEHLKRLLDSTDYKVWSKWTKEYFGTMLDCAADSARSAEVWNMVYDATVKAAEEETDATRKAAILAAAAKAADAKEAPEKAAREEEERKKAEELKRNRLDSAHRLLEVKLSRLEGDFKKNPKGHLKTVEQQLLDTRKWLDHSWPKIPFEQQTPETLDAKSTEIENAAYAALVAHGKSLGM